MSATPAGSRYASVLVTTDLSHRAALALPQAVRLIGGHGTLHMAHVLELPVDANPLYAHYGPSTPSAEERAHLEAESRRQLSEELARANLPPGIRVQLHVVQVGGYDVVPRLCALVTELGAEAVCVASHGRRGLARLLMGSVTTGLLSHCPVPVLVVRVPGSMLGAE